MHTAEFTLPKQYTTNRANGALHWIVSHLTRHWILLLGVLIGALSNALLAALVPDLTGQAFDAILASPPQMTALLRIAVLLVISQLIRSVLQLVRNFSAELIGQRMERDIRDELYLSLLGKSMTFHSLQPVGDTMARATNDVREINLMFSPGLNLVVGSAMFLLAPILFAARYHPALVLTPLVFLIGYIIALGQYLGELQPITRRVRQTFGDLNAQLSEALDGIETVKAAAQETAEVARFIDKARNFRDAFVHQGDVEARFLPLLLLGLALAAGLLHALLLFQQGEIRVGQVVAYFGQLNLLGFPTFVSLFAYAQVSTGLSAAGRILELINRETDLDQNEAGYHGTMQGEIEFRNVTFAYDEDEEPVLTNVSFHVERGQRVAIVGQTGAGKTTLVKLLNRTYDVNEGQVLIDGIDVRDWNLEALRRQISIIEQDIFLFSRSIRNNITFGRQNATQEGIEAAARAAQAHEFIVSFKDGYDSQIGERGVALSGGQRQRLALARAFLTNPTILVLDDSTSAIDSATEDKIQRAIYAASEGRTTILITHRLSQIRWADLIVVLRKGHVAACGTHEELMETSEAYRRIFAE